MKQTSQKNHLIELYWLLITDLLMIVTSYVLALLARFGSVSNSISELHFSTCLCFMFVSAIYSLTLNWNTDFIKRGYFVELIAILKYNLVMVLLVACFLFVTSAAADFSRLIWGYVFIFNTILTYFVHITVKIILKRYYRSEHCRVKTAIITDSEDYVKILERLSKSIPVNYDIEIAILLHNYNMEQSINNIPIIVEIDDVLEKLKQVPLDEIFIHVKNSENDKIRNLIQDFEEMGIICHYNLEVMEWNAKESRIGKFGDYTVVSYSIFRIDYTRRLIKRGIDIIGGSIGLIITMMLYPFIAIAIKFNSKGPVLFSQVRIGKNGRRFKVYKFRSMYEDAELKKKELESKNEASGLMFKMKDDPRITKVGKFLRKTSLDELPQFYNVLRGDMSLIGTRPPTEDEFAKYSPYYRRRLCITPGLTGMWQVSGRSEIQDFDEVVRLDLEYIENWSLTLDIKILLKTIWVVFSGRGAK